MAVDWRSRFQGRALAAGILVPTASDGIYGRSSVYEGIVAADRATSVGGGRLRGSDELPVPARDAATRAGAVRLPVLLSRHDRDGVDLQGDNADHKKLMDVAQSGGDWTDFSQPADVSLVSRRLPSALSDPDRAPCPRRQPLRRVGLVLPPRAESRPGADAVVPAARPRLRRRRRQGRASTATAGCSSARRSSASLGLMVETVVANDPVLRAGRANSGREPEVGDAEIRDRHAGQFRRDIPTAIASANCHLDHFGAPFGIVTADGEVAHSCCFGFGLDRITLALLRTHGLTRETGRRRRGTDSGREPGDRTAARCSRPRRLPSPSTACHRADMDGDQLLRRSLDRAAPRARSRSPGRGRLHDQHRFRRATMDLLQVSARGSPGAVRSRGGRVQRLASGHRPR